MKKLTLIVLASVLLALTSPFVNGQNNVWSLPPNYIKHTVSGPVQAPLPIPVNNPWGSSNDPTDPYDGYDGQEATYSHNAMQNKYGDLMFFIVDNFIYNKDGYFIQEFNSQVGGSELMIVPAIDNCNRYYIFSGSQNSTSSVPWYAIFDFNENTFDPVNPWTTSSLSEHGFYCPTFVCSDPLVPINGTHLSGGYWGAGITKNGILSYAASPIINNQRYIYCQLRNNIYVLRLDAIGLAYVGEIPYQTLSNFYASGPGNRSEMELIKIASGKYRLVMSFNEQFGVSSNGFFYCDIDENSGLNILGTDNSYSYNDEFAYIHGLEFSEDGQFLYISHNNTATTPSSIDVFQFGVSTAPTPVAGIPTLEAQDFQHSQIEMGKDGKLYFANNNRLATYNPTTSTWTNNYLSINYNINSAGLSGTIVQAYTLPDQIDGMNYADHFTANTECCLENSTFSTTTYPKEQSGTQTWTTSSNPFGNTNTITVKDELIINAGANITATGLRFEFAPDAKLVIEQGARFTANSCIFTVNTDCENTPMWNGIEVHGPSASQQSVDAGRFIANSSTIEHSYYGAHNFATVKSGTPGVFWEDFNFNRGGVILATNTTFRNNHRGTVFFDFQNTNGLNGIDDESKFNNCTFVTDALLNKSSLTSTVIMAHLFGVQGVNFYGCDFKNTMTSIADNERGSGIEAYNCLLKVSSLSSDRGLFDNLTRGIDAHSAFNTGRTTKVTNTDFNNVWRGIYLKSNELAMVLNNTFNVGSNSSFWGNSYGLFLHDCNLFTVENNSFTTTHNGYCGVYVDNSGGNNNNEIYRNTFSNLAVGSQAAKSNGNQSTINGGLGLEFRCNTYTSILGADIYVSSGWVKGFQGSCSTSPINPTRPANNQFSRTAFAGDFYQPNSITDYVSYQHSQPNGYPVNLIKFNNTNTNPTTCNSYVFNPSTSCPVRNRRNLLQLKEDYALEKQQANTLLAKIDNGNTHLLLDAIQSQSAGNVKNILLAASPYLSDKVLISFIQSNMPNGHLQQVLLANSPLSENVLAVLQGVNLPKGIRNQLNNAQTGVSAMTSLNEEISYYENNVVKLKSEILQHILFEDDVVERYKEAIEFINGENACSKKSCELVSFYILNKDYQSAQTELATLSQDVIYDDFVKLNNNIITLEQSQNIEQELSNNNLVQQEIIAIADASTRKNETSKAEVLLKRAKLRIYQEEVEELILSGSGFRLMNHNEETQNSTFITQHSIAVFPNPTSGEVNITHNLNLENGKVNFKVYNMLGVEVLNENLTSTNNEVQLNNLKSGIYFYTITQNNQSIKTDKLMVK